MTVVVMCQTLHVLPSQILKEDQRWVRALQMGLQALNEHEKQELEKQKRQQTLQSQAGRRR